VSHPNESTALAAVVLDELVRCGVVHLAVAPGSRSAALAIAAARRPEMQVAVLIDERSAAFHALGVGRASGRPAAVLTTSGSAVGHLFPAVIEAETGLVPLLLLTADRPPELHGVGANQTIEQSDLFGGHVRWSATLDSGQRSGEPNHQWRSAVCAAVDATIDGPVHLNLAFREPLVPETDDGRDRGEVFDRDTSGRPDGARWIPAAGTERRSAALEDRWSHPERGVVIAGDAPFAHVDDLDRLAAMLGWPLVIEPTAGGRPAQAVTTAHHLLSDPALADRLRPDVALVIGRVNLSRPLGRWLSGLPRLVVDPRIERPPDAAAELVSGFPRIGGIGPRTGDWRRLWLTLEAGARPALDRWLDARPGCEPAIARDTARAVPAHGTLVAASSMPIRDLDLAMATGELRVVSNRGASGIDGFVATAFGVAASTPGPVVALGGDLAMLHDSNGFLLEPRPDVVFVVVNNDGGGIFSFLPQSRQQDVFERVFGTPHGRSFELLAAFHGVGHQRLQRTEDQVASALAAGGTWILEGTTDRTANVTAHRELTAATVAGALASLEG
jgi:2-succinyl-5-enolpyruvyl-6-hydroxy-3-cyclohexene-1-carboxylate synthase